MPRGRYRYRRRRYGRRRKRKRYTLRKTVRKVRGLERQLERKVFITTRTSEGSFVNGTTTPNITSVFGPTQGDANDQLIGRKCMVKHMVLRLLVKSASSEPSILRCVVIRQKWNQELDAPTLGDIYYNVSTAGTGLAFPLQPKFNNIGRNYQTLYDETIVIGAFSNTVDQRFGSGETVKHRLVRIPLNKPYSAVPGLGGFQGRLYVIVGINDSTGVASYCYSTSVYYTDA